MQDLKRDLLAHVARVRQRFLKQDDDDEGDE
jgi:hypothetical protein